MSDSLLTQIYKPQVWDFESKDQLFNKALQQITDRIFEINGSEGIVRLAFSGGSTIKPLLKLMRDTNNLPWEQIEIFQTDERYVNKNDARSNQKLIRDSLGIEICQEVHELNLMQTDLPLKIAVKNYEEKLDTLDGNFFDLVILGVGSDGHIASLFPSGKYLTHLENSVIATTAPEYLEVPQRISLTIESILNSREVILLINGQNKNKVLTQILEGNLSASSYPVKFLLAHPNLKIFHSFDLEKNII